MLFIFELQISNNYLIMNSLGWNVFVGKLEYEVD